MPPSASKQKRMAEKAAKATLKAKGSATTGSTTTGSITTGSTPGGSEYGGSPATTPMTNLSANASHEDIKTAMQKLALATNRLVAV